MAGVSEGRVCRTTNRLGLFHVVTDSFKWLKDSEDNKFDPRIEIPSKNSETSIEA